MFLEVTIMKGFMIKFAWGGMLTLAVMGPAARELAADDKAPESRSGDSPRGLQFQELEDPIQPLEPKEARTTEEAARVDALAWFGAGRVLQHRGNFAGALSAYEKAVERDPKALGVYRELIPLAVELRRIDDAVKWALKATELSPGDQQFLMQAAALLINREDVSGAIKVLERAANAPGMDKHSAQYVNIMRDLAVLCQAAGRNVEAATGLEVLFDALTNPDKYKLDFKTRAQLQSGQATTYERMGQVFLEAKKTDLALAAFRKAVETKKGPAAAGLSFNLAQAYLQADQPQEALDELQKYIDSQRQSKGRAAYELLAEILAKLGKSDELIARLEAAAEKDSRNSILQFYLAEQYVAAERFDQAEALYKKTLEFAAEAPGYIGLAGVYRRENRPAELLDALAHACDEAGDVKAFAKGASAEFKAIAADEKLRDALLKTAEKLLADPAANLEFSSGYVLANVAADAKSSELAEKLYRHILSLRKDQAAEIYEELGGFFLEARKYPEAVAVFQEAADDPDLSESRPVFLFLMSQPLELTGDTKGALEAIAAAQEAVPNNPLFLYQEAWVYYHSRQFDEAIERMEKLIADFPSPQPPVRPVIRRAQYSLSNIYVLKGDVPKGEAILEEIYADDPDDTSVNNDLGYLYADQGKNLEQAEAMIRKALAAEPENGAYLDSLGWVLFKRGKYDEALPYLEKAVKNSPGAGDETLWEHLGEALDHVGKRPQALEALKKALEFAEKAAYPDKKLMERVKERIAEIEKNK
jgi:tetratricopeptide (TPR) repeat protein